MDEQIRFWENLFVCVMQELRQRHNGNIYDMIRASGLLRQLLNDGGKSLAHLANKKHRTKLIFSVRDNSHELKKTPALWWGRLNGSDPKDSILKVGLDNFLKRPVCIYHQYTYTVEDIIDYFSYFIGGIHTGMPVNDKEETFTKIFNKYNLIKDMPTKSLNGIIDAVITALQPLEELIKDHLKGHTKTGGF